MLIRSPAELALFVINQRRKLKLTQTEVGERVGLKQQTVSAFENKPEGSQIETLFHILSSVNLEMQISAKDKATKNNESWKSEW